MLRRPLLSIAAVVLLAPACGNDNASANIDRNEEVPVEVSFKLRGDVELSFEGTVQSRFVVFRTNDSELQSSQLAGFEPVEPVKIGDGFLLAGAAVVPYRGDGEYTIQPGSPGDLYKASQEGKQPKASSSIKVEWWSSGDLMTEPERYVRRVEPCTVRVDDRGTRGVVRCPKVTTEVPGEHVSVEMSWKAPTTPAPTTTMSTEPTTTTTS